MLWNPVISSCVLHSNMLSDIRYSDISLKAVLVTAFTTSGYSSEWFVMKHLWLGGRRREDYLFSDTRQDYRYSTHFPSQMFESSPAQILKFFEKTSRSLFLSEAITLAAICGSASSLWRVQQTLLYWSWLCLSWLANFTLYRYAVFQDFESCTIQGLKTRLEYFQILPLQFQLCLRLVLNLHPCRFSS